jgi:hypothetical protein
MSYDDFTIELAKAGLSIRRFATLLGMQPNSISNNKQKGDVPAHLAVIASLLAEMTSHKLPFEPVFERLQPNRKRPRGAARPGKFAGDPQGLLELDR